MNINYFKSSSNSISSLPVTKDINNIAQKSYKNIPIHNKKLKDLFKNAEESDDEIQFDEKNSQQIYIPERLKEFFDQREIKEEFYPNEFFVDKKKLISMGFAQKKAQRIYLNGAVKHVKSQQEDKLFQQGWQERFKFIKQQDHDDIANRIIKYKALRTLQKNTQSTQLLKNYQLQNEEVDNQKDIACQVSQHSSIYLMPQNYLSEVEQLIIKSSTVLKQREKNFNPMMSSKVLDGQKKMFKLKFNTTENNFQQLKQKSEKLNSNQNQKKPLIEFLVTPNSNIIKQTNFKKNLRKLKQIPQKLFPEEADIFQKSLAISQRKIKQYYDKINS